MFSSKSFFFFTARTKNFINSFQQENEWIHIETWTASPPGAGRVGKEGGGEEGRPRGFPSGLQQLCDLRVRARFPPSSCRPSITQGSPAPQLMAGG